jgi:flagellar motor protein MotB
MFRPNSLLEKANRRHEFAQSFVDGDLQRFQFRGSSLRAGFFAKGDASVASPRDLQMLQEFGRVLAKPEALRSYKRIIVEGHADVGEGDEDTVLQLSLQRAVTVARRLQECGLDLKRMEVTGRGSAEPVTRKKEMTEAEFAARNRRLEIVIVYGGERALHSLENTGDGVLGR